MKKVYAVVALSLVVAFVAACRPAVAPAPAPSPATEPAPLVVAPRQVGVSPQEEAWARVVAAAKREGKVSVYSYNMVGDVGIAVSRAFEQRYGIKMEIVTGMGAAIAERVSTERRMGTIVADVMDANTFQIGNIKAVGATVASADLPALQEKGVWLMEPWVSDADRHALSHTIQYMTTFMNTDLVKPGEEPRSFKELAQPKWKGKIIETDPRLSSGAGNLFPSLLRRDLITLDTIKALGLNGVTFASNSQEANTALVQGRYSFYMVTSPGLLAIRLTDGVSLPVKPLDMQEGILATNRAISAIKDSPHPNASKVLINWLFTQEGQTVFTRAQALPSVRKDTPDFTPAQLRLTPTRPIAPTLEEERENIKMFREGWLAKLWNR